MNATPGRNGHLLQYFKLNYSTVPQVPRHYLQFQERKDAARAYAHFFCYIHTRIERYFVREPQSQRCQVWDRVNKAREVDLVITIPRSCHWDCLQEDMRSAAVASGFVHADDAQHRVHFVSEREAAKWFVMKRTPNYPVRHSREVRMVKHPDDPLCSLPAGII
jgi:D-mannonate dehydratase